MKKMLYALAFLCFSITGTAQTYPFSDNFESYTNFTTLGTQGGYLSDMSVYQTHGINSSKGLIAQMNNFNRTDTTVTPSVGPLNANSQIILFYRIVDVSLYPATATTLGNGDQVQFLFGNQTSGTYFSVYTLNSTNHVPSNTFRQLSIPLNAFSGASGNIKIRVVKPSAAADFFVDIDSFAVRDASVPTSTITSNPQTSNPRCTGTATGKIVLNAGGGTPPFTYQWSNNGSADSIVNLAAGTYSVTVRDQAGDSLIQNFTLTDPQRIRITGRPHMPCPGGNNGSIQLRIFGGTAPYTYAWTPVGGNTDSTWGISDGETRCVRVTDANNCFADSCFTLNANPWNVNSIINAGLCYPDTGFARIQIQGGGQGPFNIVWNNGTTGPVYSGWISLNDSVYITDRRGCNYALLLQDPGPTQYTPLADSTPVTTPGGSDGSITLTLSPAASATWFLTPSDSNNTGIFTGLNAACFTPTAVVNGCTVNYPQVCLSDIPSGIEEIASAFATVFPNPVGDLLTIQTSREGRFKVSIFDLSGKLMEQFHTSSVNTIRLPVSTWQSGTYWIQLEEQNGPIHRFPFAVK